MNYNIWNFYSFQIAALVMSNLSLKSKFGFKLKAFHDLRSEDTDNKA